MSSSAYRSWWRGLRLSLRSKLSLSFLAFAFAGLTAGGALVQRNIWAAAQADVEDRLSYETTMLGQMTAGALFGEVDPADTSLQAGVSALGKAVHTQLAILAKDGSVVADSASDDPRSLPPQAGEPEVLAARQTGAGMAVRGGRIFVARAILSNGVLLGFARSSASLESIETHVRDVRRRFSYGVALAALVAVLLGYAISSRMLRPMRALVMGARRVDAGDLLHPIAVTSRDEIAQLSATFNDITGSLRETIAKLDSRNQDMRLVLDNVSQGLLTLDRCGVISAERSATLDAWFGPPEPGTTFWKYISATDDRASGMFRCAWEELIEGVMPFEVSFDQLPSRISAKDRTYLMQYTPLRDASRDVPFNGMLVVISDVTARLTAERAEAEQREIASAFERIARDRFGFVQFFSEAENQVAELTGNLRPTLAVVRRKLHTLKGNASTFGLSRIATLCHELEDRIALSESDLSLPDRAEMAGAWDRLAERLRTLLGEYDAHILDVKAQDCDELVRAVLGGEPRHEIARRICDWKLEKVHTTLHRFASQARELAARSKKVEVDVHIVGDDIRLSREALAGFWTTFTHVVRNAIDHGFESPSERTSRGKPPIARLSLCAIRRDGAIVIDVTDDGRGIDWDAVAERAKELGLAHEDWSSLNEALFREGFSTRASASELSGRGVGLGAARHECERLDGTVSIISERGRGTTVRFILPFAKVGGMDLSPSDFPGSDAAPSSTMAAWTLLE